MIKSNNWKVALMLLAMSFASCEGDDDSDDTQLDNTGTVVPGDASTIASDENQPGTFTVARFLESTADNFIIPAYAQSKTDAIDLEAKVSSFVNSPDANSLDQVREAYRAAFISWQKAVLFNFGPAEKGSLKSISFDINTYPVDPAKTEEYILARDVSFNNFNRDTRGFSIVDYLLFNGSDLEVLSSFDDKRKAYLNAVVNDILTRISNVESLWKTSYRDQFVANTSIARGSSVSLLYNNFLIGYENIKNYKLSIPAGMAVGQDTPDATKLEAYYDTGLSKQLILVNFEAIEAIWYGRSYDGVDGIGFEEWIQSFGETEIELNTIAAFEAIKSKLSAIEEASLADALNNDLASVEAVVTEFQKTTRYIKSNLSPVIRVDITYNSGDGD